MQIEEQIQAQREHREQLNSQNNHMQFKTLLEGSK